jgi:hypothetical protein
MAMEDSNGAKRKQRHGGGGNIGGISISRWRWRGGALAARRGWRRKRNVGGRKASWAFRYEGHQRLPLAHRQRRRMAAISCALLRNAAACNAYAVSARHLPLGAAAQTNMAAPLLGNATPFACRCGGNVAARRATARRCAGVVYSGRRGGGMASRWRCYQRKAPMAAACGNAARNESWRSNQRNGAEMALCNGATLNGAAKRRRASNDVTAGIGMLKISGCLAANTGVTASGVAAISAARERRHEKGVIGMENDGNRRLALGGIGINRRRNRLAKTAARSAGQRLSASRRRRHENSCWRSGGEAA